MRRVFVAFKLLGGDDTCVSKWVVALTKRSGVYPGDYTGERWNTACHVELVLEISCHSRCVYCTRRTGRRQHRVSYSVTTMPDRDRVFVTVDRAYKQRWLLFALTLNKAQFQRIQLFLQKQRGKPFNNRGAWWNFLCARFCLLPPLGCRYRADCEYSDHTEWFCTEMVVAALQSVGLCSYRDPCCVSPNELLAVLATCQRPDLCVTRYMLPGETNELAPLIA